MNIIGDIFAYLIVPGGLFSCVAGLLACWVDRKVSARVQYRQGPPWFQPFADIGKLLGKETLIPEGAVCSIFLGAPLVALAAAVLVSTMLWQKGFIGDLIVIIYLLTIPSVAIIIGASSSRNPLAALGASREMKLILAYELPFIIALFSLVGRAKSLMLGELVGYQAANGWLIFSWSGAIAFMVSLLVVQAKSGLVPFDIAEAEQEIAAGAFIEYSGPALALFKLTKAVLLWVLPLFLVNLFLGGIDLSSWVGWLSGVAKYVFVLTLMILIKNTNPRLRIDQALRFFWGPVTILAILGFVLGVIGL